MLTRKGQILLAHAEQIAASLEEIRQAVIEPGWAPGALHFTASYFGVSRNFVVAKAGEIAVDVAHDHAHRFGGPGAR